MAEDAAARRQKTKRTGVRLGIGLVIVLAAAFAYSLLTGDDDSSDDTETAGTTTTGEGTTTTTAPGATTTIAPGATPPFAYGTTACPPAQGTDEPTLDFEASFQQCIDPAKSYTATFATSEGDVVVNLDTARTPGTVNNFVSLARSLYYDGTELFRTDPSIGIIQGGSPHTNDASDPGPGYTIPDEGGPFDFTSGQGTGPFTYQPGQLVMARGAGPNSGSAQFFLTADEAVSGLDSQGTYVVFGEVTEGLDVLEAILALHEPDPSSQLGGAPSQTVTVESVTITEG
ncbi:MAG: peptidylprolyl isomerase [Acidimicrobiales bacterium]